MWLYKLNKVLGLSDEGLEKVRDFLYNFSQRKITLTDDEKKLCSSFGVDARLARILKSHKLFEVMPLPSVSEYGEMDFDNQSEGICAFRPNNSENPTAELHRVIYRNKQKYLKKGFELFYFEGDKYEEYFMALVKNKTISDILRWRKTDGINHNIDNTALIAKIEEWQQKYDLALWGCGRDWLQIFFIHKEPKYNHQLGASNKKYYSKYKLWKERTPKFKKFADEVIEFCPDVIEQVYGSKTKLIEGMKQMNGVYMWWD